LVSALQRPIQLPADASMILKKAATYDPRPS